MAFHRDLLGEDLHPPKFPSISGSPIGVRTPRYIGETIVNEDNQTIYRSNGLTDNDWEVIGGTGGITALEDMEDVSTAGRTDGDTVIWNESGEVYEHGKAGASVVEDLTDVDITDREDGAFLKWNETESEYQHVTDTTNIPVTNKIQVDVSIGSDVDGNGSLNKPYKSIKHALDSITDNDENTRYEIVIAPGVYTEDNPITLKNYVSIVGFSSLMARIEAGNTGQDLFDLPGSPIFSEVQGVTFYNAAAVIDIDTDSEILFRDCLVWDCGFGYTINANADTLITIIEGRIIADARTLTTFVRCLSGRVTLRSTTFEKDVNVDTVVEADGADAFAVINGMSCISSNTTNGIYAKNGAQVLFDGVLFKDMTNGLRADSGSLITGYSFDVFAETWDILQENTGGTAGEYRLSAGQITNFRKSSLTDSELFRASLTYQEPGGEIASFTSRSFSVGLAEKGRTASFGEGDSASRGLLAYRYDGANFTDVSEICESPDGSTFTFPTTTDSGFYISTNIMCTQTGDCKQFLGFKINFDSPMVIGSGDYVMEYWNGSSWAEISYMVTEAYDPYIPKNENLQNLAGAYNIRFNCLTPSDWTKNDPISSGTDRWWVRFRITSEIDFSPEIEEIVVHPNRTVFNRDGWPEYFGTARPLSTLPWHWGLVEGAINSPSSRDVYIADNIAVGMQENRFSYTGTSGVGFVSSLPFDCDTGCPIRLRLSWFPENGETGDVYWRARVAYTSDGDAVYSSSTGSPATHPTEKTDEQIVSIGSGDGETQITTTLTLPINDLVSRRDGGNGDHLWIYVERAAGESEDTYDDYVVAFSITPIYTKWCEGSHEGTT